MRKVSHKIVQKKYLQFIKYNILHLKLTKLLITKFRTPKLKILNLLPTKIENSYASNPEFVFAKYLAAATIGNFLFHYSHI